MIIFNTIHKAVSKLLLLSLIPLPLFITVSCDSVVEKTPRAELTSDSFFLNADHAEQATNATYAKMRDWNIHVFAFLGLTDMMSDDATKGSTPTDAAQLLEFENFTYDPGHGELEDWWEGNFQGIYRANLAIQNIPGIDMDEQLRNRLVGENRFLRAYFYMNLVRGFGGVPKITAPLTPDEFEQERATREEIYDLIIEDLEFAAEHLPYASQYSSDEIGRATRGAAHGMLARVHLYISDYDQALSYAGEVMDSGEYELVSDYRFIFTEDGENSRESLFEVQNTARDDGQGSSQYSQVQGVRGTPNLGWGFNNPSVDLMEHYEPGDPRQKATILYVWQEIPDGSELVVQDNVNMIDERYNKKAFAPSDHPGLRDYGPVNIRRMRYSDIVLIAAESAYQTGNESAARDYLNQVRERARNGREVTIGIQPEDMSSDVNGFMGDITVPSGMMVRYVNSNSAAENAGIQGFTFQRSVIDNLDMITAINGTQVTNVDEYINALENHNPGETVTVDVVRATQEVVGGQRQTSTEELELDIEAEALLPDVTESGEALLEAIWHERRMELAMEQKRWFDLVRQGRAAQRMQELGKDFVEGKHELYPIPSNEIDLSQGKLEQNPNW